MVNPADVLAGNTPGDFKKCARRFDDLESQITTLQPQVPDASLIKDELSITISMARHGTHRPVFGGTGSEALILCNDLQEIIARYETLWLQRNRPGGLRKAWADYARL